MGKSVYIFCFLVGLLSVWSCIHQEPDIPTPKVSFSDSVVPDYTSVSVRCSVGGNVSAEELAIELSKDESFSITIRENISKNGNDFWSTITGLEANTHYYYKYSIKNKLSVHSDNEVRSFSTLAYSVPSVSTVEVKDISEYRATVVGRIEAPGGKPILEKGFYVGKDKNYLQKYVCNATSFSIDLLELEDGTTYYYQAYARTEVGLGTGEVLSFNTKAFNPEDYLNFEIVTGGTILWKASGMTNYKTIEYSKNEGKTWVKITATEKGTPIPVDIGDNLIFRGDNTSYAIGFDKSGIISGATLTHTGKLYAHSFCVDGGASFYAYGPVTSLLNVAYRDQLADYTFTDLFYGCTGLLSHPQKNLLLPSTSIGLASYASMFEGCTALTRAPELPATTLANDSYFYMFSGCTTLSVSPPLPAIKLQATCYASMFANCTNLEQAGDVLAEQMAFYSCETMFFGCTRLTQAPELPAKTLATGCYVSMFGSCSNLVDAPSLTSVSLAEACYADMFSGCSGLINAPVLPATSLAKSCYYSMFEGCSSLATAPTLPATTLKTDCYGWMFQGCISLANAPVLPAIKLEPGCYDHMFSGCNKLQYVKCLATDIPAESCTDRWLAGVQSIGYFICPESMTSVWSRGSSGIPSNWFITGIDVDNPEGYLTFEVVNGGYITWTSINEGYKTIEYSKDNGKTWTSITSTNSGAMIPVISGDILLFRGNNDSYCSFHQEGNNYDYSLFGTSLGTSFYAYGPVTSLLNKNTRNELVDYAFYALFDGCKGLLSHPYKLLTLPSLSLATSCYSFMFSRCTDIERAPDLPASSLARSCYAYMFDGCTKLKEAPELEAKTLAYACYSWMFAKCSSLISAPMLPAETLAGSCYDCMFYDCTSLSVAPVLPANKLENYCYYNMFGGCRELSYVCCFATDVSAKHCTDSWLKDVSSIGTFVKAETMNDWSTGPSGIPSGWTVKNRGDE